MVDRGTQPALDLVRQLRAEGRHADAAALLEATLGQPELQQPDDPSLASEVAWLGLEQAQLLIDQGNLTHCAQTARRALALHEYAGDAAGAAAAYLVLADVAWLSGAGAQATSLWAQARAKADQGHAPLLAARALLALALREWQQGEAGVAEQLVAAAEERTSAELEPTPDVDAQVLTLRAASAVVRAARAVAHRRNAEAQLLLAVATQAARQVGELSLYMECLRVDARLARHSGDPHGAVQSLRRARDVAVLAGMDLARVALEAELGLALIDDEDWQGATAIVEAPLSDAALAVPAVRALRLDLTAALALHGGRSREAALLWQEASLAHGDDHAGTCRSLVGLAEAHWRHGDAEAARAALAKAQELADSAGRADLRIAPRLAELNMAAASAQDTTELAKGAVELAAQVGSTAQQLAALDQLAASHLARGHAAQARPVARQQVALAQAQPLLRWQARALARLAQTLVLDGDAGQGLRVAEQALRAAQQAGDAQGRVRALLASATALQALGRIDEAQLSLSHAQGHAEGGHLPDLALDAQLEQAQLLATHRNVAVAEPMLAHLLSQSLAQQRGTAAYAAALTLAWCARQRGDLQAAGAALAHLSRLPVRPSANLTLAVALEQARIDLARGRLDLARQLGHNHEFTNVSSALRGEARLLTAEAYARSGEWKTAATLADQALADLRQARSGRSLGAGLYLAGQIAAARGHGEQAGALLGEALLVTAQLGLPEQATIRATIERLRNQQGEHTTA